MRRADSVILPSLATGEFQGTQEAQLQNSALRRTSVMLTRRLESDIEQAGCLLRCVVPCLAVSQFVGACCGRVMPGCHHLVTCCCCCCGERGDVDGEGADGRHGGSSATKGAGGAWSASSTPVASVVSSASTSPDHSDNDDDDDDDAERGGYAQDEGGAPMSLDRVVPPGGRKGGLKTVGSRLALSRHHRLRAGAERGGRARTRQGRRETLSGGVVPAGGVPSGRPIMGRSGTSASHAAGTNSIDAMANPLRDRKIGSSSESKFGASLGSSSNEGFVGALLHASRVGAVALSA